MMKRKGLINHSCQYVSVCLNKSERDDGQRKKTPKPAKCKQMPIHNVVHYMDLVEEREKNNKNKGKTWCIEILFSHFINNNGG